MTTPSDTAPKAAPLLGAGERELGFAAGQPWAHGVDKSSWCLLIGFAGRTLPAAVAGR